MGDPLSMVTGILTLVTVALQLVTGASGLIDKTIAAHRAADEELERLKGDLEELQSRVTSVHGKLTFLASNTKDRGFKKLLTE